MSDASERTFEPTPARRERFRKEGKIARARDAGPLAATAAVLALLVGSREAAGAAVARLFLHTHGDLGAFVRGDLAPLREAAVALGGVALPCAAAAAIGSVVAGVAQAGFHVELDLVTFKPERLDPIGRLSQLFSPTHALVETMMGLLRVGAVGFFAIRALVRDVPQLFALGALPADAAAARTAEVALDVVLQVLGGLALVAAIDYAQSRFSLEKQMKMTRRELLDETRSQDGDPKVKGRQRAHARALAKRRALGSVKSATVVVTNPTHVAVALRYGTKDPAPIVVAKGQDEIALAIRGEARRCGIPIVESRALARALEAEVQVGRPIPEAHYAAVARILAVVLRLSGRKRGTSPA